MVRKMFVHIGNGNRKTGKIPTTTSSKTTCPDACPLKESGCYAKYSFLGNHWQQVTEGKRGVEWSHFLQQVRAFAHGQLWRHNQAGDLPGSNNMIDGKALSQLVKANKGKRGFTYTHYPLNFSNVEAIEQANKGGFTINASANSAQEAAQYVRTYGVPTVALLPIDAPNVQTVSGVKVVACPAEKSDKVTCATCALCADSKRDYVIGFRAHGTAKKKVSRIATVTE